MIAATGTVMNGLVVLDEPVPFPDGSRVLVRPVEIVESSAASEAGWQDSPEAIRDWIAWYDSLESIEVSAADQQALGTFRQRQKEIGESDFDERVERLRKIWQ